MPEPKDRASIKVAAERAALVALHLPGSRFDPRDPLGELRALAVTAGAEVVAEMTQRRDKPEAGTYLGAGKLDELRAICDEARVSVVIFDNDLSPAQIGNIEKAIERKVVDRSELILDIFASRATTREARLQVELAQLEYTYPRLRAMWSHLERIVGSGGIGGIGTRGPGEQQIEIDRRLVQRRATRLKRELEEIQDRKARAVAKRKQDHFTVGLVGYTNAGKSTLFNAITEGGAYADDRLFATLMTRTREWDVGDGESVMLSDTVGFVRDLPHNLVASFRATLEEATHADLLLIVLDVSDPSAELQYETVIQTLDDIMDDAKHRSERAGVAWTAPERMLVLNKVDLLRDNSEVLVWQSRHPDAISLSARDLAHPGRARLRKRVRALAAGAIRKRTVTIPTSNSKAITLLERRAKVLEREYVNGAVTFTIEIGDRQAERLRSAGVPVGA